MNPHRKSLIGRRFGRLRPVINMGKNAFGNSLWMCQCDCGEFHKVLYHNLTTGRTKSCGCLLHPLPGKPNQPATPREWI